MRRIAKGALLVLALGGVGAAHAVPPDPRQEVRRRMHRLFEARLRADLGLDDATTARVIPRLEEIERGEARARRERMRLLRELRRGLESGMSDAGLQERLEALDRIARDAEAEARTGLADVDRELTVPQRVRLRFLLAEFRSEMRRGIREIAPRRDPRGAP
ncbi:MAG TPA: hypothetical protein VFB67_02670 [Candidatus Polarisedimenticolaceae bacterium]|nr:hypothetical protein [Candidatus Polarisedimenticolaceae bacterium]